MSSFWTFLQLIFVVLQVSSLVLTLYSSSMERHRSGRNDNVSLIIGIAIWWWSRRNALTALFRQPFLSSDSMQLFEQVFNDLPTRVYWRDSELKLLGGNEAFADLGLNPEEVTVKSDNDIPVPRTTYFTRERSNNLQNAKAVY